MTVARIAVVGAGTMGAGIARLAAEAGYQVCLHDARADALAAALDRIEAGQDRAVEKGRLDPEAAAAARARIDTRTDLEAAVEEADLVVEAIFEDLEAKQELAARVGTAAPARQVFATNTSSLPVTAIAAAHPRPERVLGMHFFNPVSAMPLLELVRAHQTAPEVLVLARAVANRLGKECIEVVDSPGFATSRLGLVLGLEAMRMLEAGVASAEDIDRAMVLGYRHPMGPLRLTDLVGLDVRLAIAEHLHRELGEAFRPPTILRRLVRAGHLGRKTGRGFYEWSDS